MPLRIPSFAKPATGAALANAHVVIAGYLVRSETRQAEIAVDVYADQAAYQAGKAPEARLAFSLGGAGFDALDSALLARLYTHLKSRAELAGAVDA